MNLDMYPFLLMYSFKTLLMSSSVPVGCLVKNDMDTYFWLGPFKNDYLQVHESENDCPNNTEYLV